ncbi:SHOCT domain-containing protein [Adhaeribacter aquaticus]|uniref:SHOCT domain-containing protein n=1 Tax=Adhaeribacter aquaticus TaxID=299567 RepID=UPI000410F380|nr:SHOCT domain-containing protein [Adhaeribacter aquaticus]
MENDFSAIKSLNELKNLLDSGAITPEEFVVLKRKIIYGNALSTNDATILPSQPEPESLPANADYVEADPVTPDYSNESYVSYDTGLESRNTNTDAIGPDGVASTTDYSDTKGKDWLVTILVTLGVFLMIGLIAYQFFGDKDSEKLTSKSGPTEEVIGDGRLDVPKGPDAEPQITTVTTSGSLAGAASPENGTSPATTVTDNTTTAATEAQATAPSISNEEALERVKDRLQSFYDDLKAAPFSAQRHFASNVERFYTLANTTPAAINDNINTNHFPEFQESEATIEDGSIKLENNTGGGYEVTFIEHGTAFRKSKGQKQETTARVRAKFDQSFKLIYFRQEQLLENKFLEANGQ